jgi:hypothetical protein
MVQRYTVVAVAGSRYDRGAGAHVRVYLSGESNPGAPHRLQSATVCFVTSDVKLHYNEEAGHLDGLMPLASLPAVLHVLEQHVGSGHCYCEYEVDQAGLQSLGIQNR